MEGKRYQLIRFKLLIFGYMDITIYVIKIYVKGQPEFLKDLEDPDTVIVVFRRDG